MCEQRRMPEHERCALSASADQWEQVNRGTWCDYDGIFYLLIRVLEAFQQMRV